MGFEMQSTNGISVTIECPVKNCATSATFTVNVPISIFAEGGSAAPTFTLGTPKPAQLKTILDHLNAEHPGVSAKFFLDNGGRG
jgi:hypothetical protein